jgi:hypothetical protein
VLAVLAVQDVYGHIQALPMLVAVVVLTAVEQVVVDLDIMFQVHTQVLQELVVEVVEVVLVVTNILLRYINLLVFRVVRVQLF